MTLAQLHYTSAPPGPDGSGFRYTAVSDATPQGVLREAEQLIGYEPPRDFPARPEAAQLALFPVSFSCTELSDGGRLLSRSVYTGVDYSGRWGNFHAHAVHLPPGARLPDGALPITVWESASWSAVTPQAGRPEPLERLAPSRLLDTAGLVGFAASRAALLGPFFADVRALAADPAAGQLILVERDSADVARWIALACAVLPREQAHRLTFTTYTRRPRQARQQIIGVLPDTEDLTHDHRYRVHDGGAVTTPAPVTDPWADLWARIWLAQAPRLFAEAGDDLGELAARALGAGVAVRADARAAAARWASTAGPALPEGDLHTLVQALCAAQEDGRSTPTAPSEYTALTELLAALDGRVPDRVAGVLAARLLRTAVPDPALPMPRVRAASLPTAERDTLRTELAPVLRSGIADPRQAASGRPLALLQLADQLDVDCADLLPGLAGRLSRELTDERGTQDSTTDGRGDVTRVREAVAPVREAVAQHPTLRVSLFGALDALAAADPVAASRSLAALDLPVEGEQRFPHLRMCGAPAPVGGDRLGVFHELLRSAGVSPHADPPTLRTALALVWPGEVPAAQEARLLLSELGSDIHRAAGTQGLLTDAALAAPADEPYVAELAEDLLRCFTGELAPRQRAALLLLELSGRLGTDGEGADWVHRILDLRANADPTPAPVVDRAFHAVARRLLIGPTPPGELYALVHSGSPELFDAYRTLASGRTVGDRLRTSPNYVAHCFSEWSSHGGSAPLWDETRTALLTKVLRPVVKALPEEDVAQVRKVLDGAGRGKLDAFEEWHRPGKLGRFAGRFAGRRRRAADTPPPSARYTDVEPPRDGDRR